ncbi:MAG: transporter substrate-binding domain-containing protein [Syntrophomonas sp.]|nr:transporter substrate-binding domain-containing protein [Syntrophomonas sp.]
MSKRINRIVCLALFLSLLVISGCGSREKITAMNQLDGKEFAVPTGTIADKLVLSKYPNAKFQYYNSVLDACMAVKAGKADAAAYDEPILKNIAAKNTGMVVLPEMITNDNYAFAVALDNKELKKAIDDVTKEIKANGTYDQMMTRWFPKTGSPASMPTINLNGEKGVLRFGTASVTEPFSFVDGSQKVVGFDIELATYVAQKLGMKLEVVNMEFGSMIPALNAGKVDMIGACITITDERSKSVLFSEPYYKGGIAALVKQ